VSEFFLENLYNNFAQTTGTLHERSSFSGVLTLVSGNSVCYAHTRIVTHCFKKIITSVLATPDTSVSVELTENSRFRGLSASAADLPIAFLACSGSEPVINVARGNDVMIALSFFFQLGYMSFKQVRDLILPD